MIPIPVRAAFRAALLAAVALTGGCTAIFGDDDGGGSPVGTWRLSAVTYIRSDDPSIQERIEVTTVAIDRYHADGTLYISTGERGRWQQDGSRIAHLFGNPVLRTAEFSARFPDDGMDLRRLDSTIWHQFAGDTAAVLAVYIQHWVPAT